MCFCAFSFFPEKNLQQKEGYKKPKENFMRIEMVEEFGLKILHK
jgi:hypothetical protein